MLNLEETDRGMSLVADKLIPEQLPDRKDIFHNTNKQKVESENFEKTKTIAYIDIANSMYKGRVQRG